MAMRNKIIFNTKNSKEIKSTFAFLLRKCICCGKTFWFTIGWRCLYINYFQADCCRKCAKNKEGAKEKCVIRTKRPNRLGYQTENYKQ